MNVDQLEGEALDRAVWIIDYQDREWGSFGEWSPSTDWAIGGGIIEREKIDVGTYRGAWRAARHVGSAPTPTYGYGPTPLIAAMRCYVASKLGDTVEIPEALCNQ